jgi:NAD(P)-dependent dehydrogenase (short-subunit alcohol dehydrogenase family)
MKGGFDLSGETALVAGGAGILGSRFCDALARHGARVAVADLDAHRAGEVAELASTSHGVAAAGFAADLADPAAVAALRRQVEQALGPVSVLVNAVAAKTAGFFEPFETYALDDWEQVMRANVTGVMQSCREFGAGMAARGQGSIINILSIYGIVAPDPRIYEGSRYEGRAINTPAVYSTSKAALLGLTRHLATYWADRGVRVNAVTPGGVFSGQNDTFVQRYSARVPMGRMADKDEMSGAIVFLASSAASYVTGQNIVVDGGLTAW